MRDSTDGSTSIANMLPDSRCMGKNDDFADGPLKNSLNRHCLARKHRILLLKFPRQFFCG